MVNWAYGLVEIEGELRLAEVYNPNKKKSERGYCTLSWKELEKDDLKRVIEDLTAQLKTITQRKKYQFKVK